MWGVLFLICGLYPLWRAWAATAGTPLRHAVAWGVAAWAAWAWAAAAERPDAYFPSCVTACAGVAVLGARRPGAAAWNSVSAGLLVVLLRPYMEGLGTPRFETAHHVFLHLALAVPVLNYLPTRQALPALLAWSACVSASPWPLLPAAWLALAFDRPMREDDAGQVWRRFRDRHGAFWAARLREQFNTAAANAGMGVRLEWGGPVREPGSGELPYGEALDGVALNLLRALLKRFGPEDRPDTGARGPSRPDGG